MALADLPSGGRDIETLSTSKHRSPPGCDHGTSPTHLGLDAGRGSSWLPHEESGCEQTFSCWYPSYHCPVHHADPFTSYLTSQKA